MAVKKLALISGSLVAVGIASVIGVGAVSAQSNISQDRSIVSKIAQKFNLNKDEVQKVFTEDNAAHQADRKAEMKTALDTAVTDGKITADQEAKLIAKLDEMQADREAAKDQTQAEHQANRTAMETKRTEFEAWLKANNIPSNLLHGPGMGMGRGDHGPRDIGNLDTTAN